IVAVLRNSLRSLARRPGKPAVFLIPNHYSMAKGIHQCEKPRSFDLGFKPLTKASQPSDLTAFQWGAYSY
ncbi:MAG: hypothetical protein Q4C10_13925, partial [Clostridia bacterium]|nr:hypothetical protein [Clostridia bacterium]